MIQLHLIELTTLPKRYDENLKKPRNLTLDENEKVMEKRNLIKQNKNQKLE